MNEARKVFISYSWSSSDHEDWVIGLAERLMADGIDVVIDKWDLKEGHDKYTFMESMVQSSDINKVLIILDKKYAEKADQRSGGVGTETQIISPSIYKNVSQEKFIPVVAERNEDDLPYIPTYLESRIYIDLSIPDTFEDNYDKLIRNIYQRPAYIKPRLGKPPGYLFEDSHVTHRTSFILRSFENQVAKNPKKVNSIVREFLEEFFEDLKQFRVPVSGNDAIKFGKEVFDSLNNYKPLRDDFIHLFEKVTREEIEFDIYILIRFLERLELLKSPLEEKGTWYNSEYEIFRFIIHQLFLYLVAIGLKNENYTFLAELFYSRYFFQDKYHQKREPGTFSEHYNHVSIIDPYYKETFSKNFFSPMADLIIKRITNGFTLDTIVDADILTHYIAELNYESWFPLTYVYRTREKVSIIERLVSAKHFERVKVIFDVKTPEELRDKLKKLQSERGNERGVSFSSSFDHVPPIYKAIDPEKIAIVR